MLVLIFFVVTLCSAFNYMDIIQDMNILRGDLKEVDLNQTFFSSLENYQVNASPATEKKYPWIAQVVHSKTRNLPLMCTAVCIDKGVFITASRCIYNLKIKWTSVVYNSKRLPVRAFVLPSKPTSQAYDDIGFIVIEGKLNEVYNAVELFEETKRTDDAFRWFANMDFSGQYKVVGYATEKGIHRIKSADRIFSLTELPIVIGIDICSTILTFNHLIEGFNVPCYHSCTVPEFKNKAEACKSYHGVEGGAVVDVKNNKLFGLATWAPYFHKYELPVGFSVVNSNAFYEDFECAKKVRAADTAKEQTGYQLICDKSS